MKKMYLGDGVYIESDPSCPDQQLRLFTNDGFKDTNEIFLETDVCTTLIDILINWVNREE